MALAEMIDKLPPNLYLRAGILFIVVVLVLRLLFLAAGKFAPKLAEKHIFRRSSRALTVLAIFIAVPVSLSVLPLSRGILELLYRVSYTLIASAIAYLIYVVLDGYMAGIVKKSGLKDELGESLCPILGGISKTLIITLLAIYVLGVWGVEAAPLLAGLGIAGLALALALQPLLGNLFNVLALVIDETFKVGDVIKLGSGEMDKDGWLFVELREKAGRL